MADAEPEAEGGSEDGCSGSRALSSQRGSAARVAPLGPEQLRRVLEQVTKAQRVRLTLHPTPQGRI